MMMDDAATDGLSRRRFLGVSVALAGAAAAGKQAWARSVRAGQSGPDRTREGAMRLFLAGDVMLGRGVDQIMPRSAPPNLYESYIRDAREYVSLAQSANGPIPRNVDPTYVWGDALDELEALAPDLRIVNLETAITASGAPWPDKGIHYRMHPANTAILQAAGIDCCALANNHVLDWGYRGLQDTLAALADAGIAVAGAGKDANQAARPALLGSATGASVAVHALASQTSGVPPTWGAGENRAGVNLVGDDLDATVAAVVQRVAPRSPGQLVVASIHWGGNWGHQVPDWQQRLAHRLIDSGAVDLVHGHSSHHPKAIEVYRGRLVLYGCGDLINDYEGIREARPFRSDLGLMYFADLDPAGGRLLRLTLSPMRMRRLRLQHATPSETDWLRTTLNRESLRFGTRLEADGNGRLHLLPADRAG
jgi:poly-gamma-glutamate synthesis protein (capsule biosynthesis protein)